MTSTTYYDDDEDEILYDSNPVMFGDKPFLFIFLLILTPFVVGLIALFAWWLGTKSNRLTVDDAKIYFQRGILSKTRKEILISNIRSIQIHQSFVQRLLKTGRIEIFTIGDVPEIVLGGLPRPYDIQNIVSDRLG